MRIYIRHVRVNKENGTWILLLIRILSFSQSISKIFFSQKQEKHQLMIVSQIWYGTVKSQFLYWKLWNKTRRLNSYLIGLEVIMIQSWISIESDLLFVVDFRFVNSITVEPPNSHTPNSHTYPNSHTLFGLTKMWLFRHAKDIRRLRSLFCSVVEQINFYYFLKIV